MMCAGLSCAGSVQAEVRVEVPGDFQILAVSDGKVQDEQHGVLADGAQAALVVNAAMESLVRESPAQYLWSYDRYKSPRP